MLDLKSNILYDFLCDFILLYVYTTVCVLILVAIKKLLKLKKREKKEKKTKLYGANEQENVEKRATLRNS